MIERLKRLRTKGQGQPAPTIRPGLKRLIENALDLPYISESCQDGIQTGNHYQSIAFNGERTAGFRTSREEVLDKIVFEGKRVLDLGSNLGELSRAARARGAVLVDGFEYDPFFVEVAGAINAHAGATRVSFHELDITKPSSYAERYDIVLAFSVFIYIQSVLDRIAECTRELLVLETHKLRGNLEQTYLEPVAAYFPYYAVLGESEWGTPHDPSDKRAIVAFAKTESALAEALTEPVSVQSRRARVSKAESDDWRYIDTRQTSWCDRFFQTFNFGSVDELLEAVDAMDIDLHELAAADELSKRVMSGWAYWLVFVKGYLQYRRAGRVEEGNVYYEYLTTYFGPAGRDPQLSRILADAPAAVERVTRRFRDLELLEEGSRGKRDKALQKIDPITVVVRDAVTGKVVFPAGSHRPVHAALIDGYHRLFAARLVGLEQLRADFVVQGERDLPRLDGAAESVQIADGRLTVRGWCVSEEAKVDAMELWSGDTCLSRATPTRRDDAVARSGSANGGAPIGFDFDVPWLREAGPQTFRLVATRSWIPVGELTADYVPAA